MKQLQPFALAVCLVSIIGCSSTETLVEDDFDFDGSCTSCHAGLSAGQVHPTFKLRCIDCHGGNDQVDIPGNAADDANVYRDPDLIAAAHVAPKPGLARFFWANGIDDDNDGIVDEGIDIDIVGGVVNDFGEIAELGLQGEGVGDFIDSEYNRDLNYVRWLNPGDLRVATVSCGGSSRPALDGEGGGACHQRIIDTSRRSIMVNQSAVINGAYYGNESWRPTFQNARDTNSPDNDDPRAGAFGYTLDYTGIDGCVDTSATGDPEGRGQPVFDSACLEANAAGNDPNSIAGAGGNFGLPAFEAQQGTIVGSAPGTEPGQTVAHTGTTPTSGRLEWGGKPLLDPAAALVRMDPVPDEELLPGVPDPIDNILRGFRAYYPLNYPASTNNFNFTFGESIRPGIDDHRTQNPFGRGHSSGCTACHGLYNYDGSRNPQRVAVLDGEGGQTFEDVIDPTTKHREFDQTQDIVNIGGRDRLVGRTVNVAERDFNEDGIPDEREQQRNYSADHRLTSRITTDQCGLCHAFVTRINFAYQGMAEDEQRDKLARDKPIAFNTGAGSQVSILDSWVREDLLPGGDPGNIDDFRVVIPAGQAVIDLAVARNRELQDLGLVAGAGGCAQNTFTEDCNNNGELDTELVLQRFDEDGDLVAETTINEDMNGNGRLDLLSHAPRHVSLDGRQGRYVYGGVNGSTRMMDIHFERGMHCIDCHFIQDSHGDGNLYSTNWDAIEIECEDCHGSGRGENDRATLFSSGANGGNDLTKAVREDRIPFFEREGGDIIQRSRVTDGVFWKVTQTSDTIAEGSEDFNERAIPAHQAAHLPEGAAPGEFTIGSIFGGEIGKSELQVASMECYACHTSWVHNCMGCHFGVNQGDDVKTFVDAAGNLSQVPGENEVWYNNRNQAARTNFQLLSLLRSPFMLGTNASADGGRLAPFRSSMIVQVSLNDTDGNTVLDNINFSTFQEVDGNSGRSDVATSGSALNQTMPHTVRPLETQGCESCHGVVNQQQLPQNDHILGQTYGVGIGRYPYAGDWAIVAGPGVNAGLELFEHKQEEQLAGNTPGASVRFPGIIVNPADRVLANIEPNFDGGGGINDAFEGTDVALIRNFMPGPVGGVLTPPTLRDLAVVSADNGATGRLVISDISIRGHPTAVQPSVGDNTQVEIVNLPGRALGLAHISPDVSDPYVYVAGGTAGLTVVKINNAPTAAADAQVLTSTAVGGRTATTVRLAGDIAYVGTAEGTLEVLDLANPENPVLVGQNIPAGGAVNAIDLGTFILYVATDNGITIFANAAMEQPIQIGQALAGTAVTGIYHAAGHLYAAAGAAGLRDIDVSQPGAPIDLGDLIPGGQVVDPFDVTVSVLPVQTWLLVSDSNGDLVGVKLNNTQSTRERCLPDPSVCKNDMDWRDPTIMGRDPSIDPNNGQPFAVDPSGPAFFRQAATLLNGGGRFAPPALWEQIGTQTGRRVRDSFMSGSGALSRSVMTRMYLTQLCEISGSEDVNGSGWGQFGLADLDFLDNGNCVPYDPAAISEGERNDGSRLSEPLSEPAFEPALTCEEPAADGEAEVGFCEEPMTSDSLATASLSP